MTEEEKSLVQAVTDVALPPLITHSLFRAAGRLVAGAFEVPTAWLESKILDIRGEAHARQAVREKAAQAAGELWSSDSSLAQRALGYYGQRIIREQANRESVLELTAAELKSNPPTDDADDDIDDDWLHLFSSIAEKKSNADVQKVLARLLVSEIKQPSSVQPRTVEVLSTLTPDVAQVFAAACCISIGSDSRAVIIRGPNAAPGSNGLANLGLNYLNLCTLQEYGLIHSQLSSWMEFSHSEIGEFTLGDVPVFPEKQSNPCARTRRLWVVNFTRAGAELRLAMDVSPDKAYVEALRSWLELNGLGPDGQCTIHPKEKIL